MNGLINILKIIRLPNLIIIALTQYAIRFGIIYPFLRQAGYSLFLPEYLFTLLVLSTVSIAAAGYIINDYFDVKLDYLNKPKQLIVGRKITRRQAMFLHLFFNGIGLFFSAYIAIRIGHPMLVLFQLVSAALLWFYTVSFKKQILLGNLVIAILTAMVPLTTGYYEVVLMFDHVKVFDATNYVNINIGNLGNLLFSIKYLLYWIIGYSVFAFLLTFAREVVKDCEDIEGDKAFGCKTFPIVYGINKAKRLSSYVILLILVFILMIMTMQLFSKDWISFGYFIVFLFLPIILILIMLFKADKKRDFFIVSQVIKVIMLFGILYTSIIYLY